LSGAEIASRAFGLRRLELRATRMTLRLAQSGECSTNQQ
jgi:hypothetical protein